MVLELVVAEIGEVDRISPSTVAMLRLQEICMVLESAVEGMRMEQILRLTMVQLLLSGEMSGREAVQESAVGVVDAE